MSEEEKVEKKEEKKQAEFLFSDGEYKKFEQCRLEYSNALIGKFDPKGDYKITPEILKEFVAMPKVIREVRDNRYYAIASSNLGSSFNVKFSVVVREIDDEKKFAILCLLEDVVNPNTGSFFLKSTPIATFRDDNDGFFIDKMKKAFNLKNIDEQIDGGLYDSNKFPNFFATKSKKIKLKGQFDASSEEIDENYVIEMLKELKKMGPYGEWVLKNIARQKSLMGDKFPQKGAKGYFKAYAALLDQAIINAKNFPLTPEQIATINRIQRARIEGVRMATSEVVLAPKPKVKAPTKSAGGGSSPSAAKKKGGKVGGKTGDKKETKKPVKKKSSFLRQRTGITTDRKSNNNTSNRAENNVLNEILEEVDEAGEVAQQDVIKGQFNNSIEDLLQDELTDSFNGRSEIKSAIFDRFRSQRNSSKERGGLER